MQFLRTLFWVVIAVVAVIFAFNNWTQVTISLWGGLRVDAKLPILLLVAFLIGLLPLFIVHRATRWTLKRRLDNAERSLAELRTPPAAVAVTDPMTATPVEPFPPVVR